MKLHISTERLILRPFYLSDAPRVRALANTLEVARMATSLPHPYPEGLAEHWIGGHDAQRASGTGYPFAVEAYGQFVGSVNIAENSEGEFALGFWIGAPYWGRGYATEAVRGVLKFAFGGRGLAYVRAHHIAGNAAAARVLDKAGFLATGRRRSFHLVRQAEIEIVHAVLPRDAFAGWPSASERCAA